MSAVSHTSYASAVSQTGHTSATRHLGHPSATPRPPLGKQARFLRSGDLGKFYDAPDGSGTPMLAPREAEDVFMPIPASTREDTFLRCVPLSVFRCIPL